MNLLCKNYLILVVLIFLNSIFIDNVSFNYAQPIDIDKVNKSEIDRQWNSYLKEYKNHGKIQDTTSSAYWRNVFERGKKTYQFEKWNGKSSPIKGLLNIPRELFLKYDLYLYEYYRYRIFYDRIHCQQRNTYGYSTIELQICQSCIDAQLFLLQHMISATRPRIFESKSGIGDIAFIRESDGSVSLKFARNNVFVGLRGEKTYVFNLAYFLDTMIIMSPILDENDKFNVPAFFLDKKMILEFQKDTNLLNERKVKFEPFLLNEDDMDGYKNKYPDDTLYYSGNWIICEKRHSHDWLEDVVRQYWVALNDHKKEIICEYCINRGIWTGGIYHLKYGLSRDFTWGSLSGLQLGDRSWIGEHHLALVKNNVGIIITCIGYNSIDYDTVEAIAQKIVRKIEEKSSYYLIWTTQTRKPAQIRRSKYDSILVNALNNELKDYTCLNYIDSKWLSGYTTLFELSDMKYNKNKKILCRDYNYYLMSGSGLDFELGIKGEWINTKGVIIVIDICDAVFDMAENLAKFRAFESDAYYVENPSDPQIPSIRWWQHTASVVFKKGTCVVHISQYNRENIQDIDTQLFRKLIISLASNI